MNQVKSKQYDSLNLKVVLENDVVTFSGTYQLTSSDTSDENASVDNPLFTYISTVFNTKNIYQTKQLVQKKKIVRIKLENIIFDSWYHFSWLLELPVDLIITNCTMDIKTYGDLSKNCPKLIIAAKIVWNGLIPSYPQKISFSNITHFKELSVEQIDTLTSYGILFLLWKNMNLTMQQLCHLVNDVDWDRDNLIKVFKHSIANLDNDHLSDLTEMMVNMGFINLEKDENSKMLVDLYKVNNLEEFIQQNV